MKYLDEYRDPRAARFVVEQIREAASRSWTLMEVCGGQAHNLMRFGIDRSLPEGLELVHGPGCPVCLATVETIDRAARIARRPGLILCTISDLLRVPGSRTSLSELRQEGETDIRVVYSPLDALALAKKNPDLDVVFLVVGFETTAPTTATAVLEAERLGLRNFLILGTHKRIVSALDAILQDEESRVQAVLAPGHLCSVVGTLDYELMAQRLRLPVIITGLEPVDLLQGILAAIRQLEDGRHVLENLYPRGVRREGNPHALSAVDTVFETASTTWRGLGTLESSSLALRERFWSFDAARRYGEATIAVLVNDECRGGEVMTGRMKPTDCPSFGGPCTLDRPLGAPMVSAEGTCAAYYRYRTRAEIRSAAESSPSLSILPSAVVHRGQMS